MFTMKKSITCILFISVGLFFWGCASGRRFTSNTEYVPFTTGLQQRILNNNLDIKKVQFFIDQKLILRKSLGSRKVDIKSGVLLFENGEYIQEVVIPKYTPGICESVNGNNLLVSFESSNNDMEFGPGQYTHNLFMLYGKNWNNGAGDIAYDNTIYKVTCGSCTSATEAKLVVKRSEADKYNTNSRVVKGRKVDN